VGFLVCLLAGLFIRIVGAFYFVHDNDFPVFWEAAERAYKEPLSIYHSMGRDDYPQPYTYFPSYAFVLSPFAFLANALALNENWKFFLGHIPVYLGDVGVCILLYRMLKDKGRIAQLLGVSLYWLSPVVLNGGVHIAHFESLVVFFLLLAIMYKNRPIACGLFLGISASFKIYGFFLLPVFLFQLNEVKKIRTIFDIKELFNRNSAKLLIAFSIVPLVTIIPYLLTDANRTLSCLVGHHATRPADYYTWLGWLGYYSNPFTAANVFLLDYNVHLVFYMCTFAAYWTRRLPIEHALVFGMLAFLFTNKFIYPQYLVVIVPLLILAGSNFEIVKEQNAFEKFFCKYKVTSKPALFYLFISVMVIFPGQWDIVRVLILGTFLSLISFLWFSYEFLSIHLTKLRMNEA